MSHERIIRKTPLEAAEECGRFMLATLGERIANGEVATLAVSGGTTPKLLFHFMAAQAFDWSNVHLFWVDERGVPPEHEQSNYRLAREHFIDPAGFPSANVHRIHAELEAKQAAARYRDELREFFKLDPLRNDMPGFDVVQQGMGADAHTASLFAGEPLIESHGVAAAVWVEKMNQWRITLLPGALLSAKSNAMLITGADKGPALRQIFGEEQDPLQWPTQLIVNGGGEVKWFVDEAAAAGVDWLHAGYSIQP